MCLNCKSDRGIPHGKPSPDFGDATLRMKSKLPTLGAVLRSPPPLRLCALQDTLPPHFMGLPPAALPTLSLV